MLDQQILDRLDILIRLTAISICSNRSRKEKIILLDGAGFAPKDIAEFLGTSPNAISVALSAIRKEQKAQAGKKTTLEDAKG